MGGEKKPGRSQKIKEGIKGCLNTSKIIVIVLYAILFILGVALIGVGISSYTTHTVFDKLHIPAITSLPIWIICIGFFLAMVSIIGAVGSCALNRCLLITFVSLLCILIFLQLGVGIATYFKRRDLPTVIEYAWDHAENSSIESVETYFKCCGLYNVSDRPVLSGCNATLFEPTVLSPNLQEWSSLDNGGCLYEILTFGWRIAKYVGGAVLGITVVEIITIAIVAALLCRIRKINKDEDRAQEEREPLTAMNEEL